jgi:hypothetical protein
MCEQSRNVLASSFGADIPQPVVQFVEPPKELFQPRLVRPVKIIQDLRDERSARETSRYNGCPLSFVKGEIYLVFLRFINRRLCGNISDQPSIKFQYHVPGGIPGQPSSPPLRQGRLYAKSEADLCCPARTP